MQINDELEVHTGLLEEFDHDLDDTGNRLGRARQRLGRVSNSAKEHGECGPVECLGLQLMKRPRRFSINHWTTDSSTVNLDNCLQNMIFFHDLRVVIRICTRYTGYLIIILRGEDYIFYKLLYNLPYQTHPLQ